MRFACPGSLTRRADVQPPGGPTRAYDTDFHGDEADLRIWEVRGQRQRAEVDTSVGTFAVQYGKGGAIAWEPLPRPPSVSAAPNEAAPAPLELAPIELSRLIPALQDPVEPECLSRPAVSNYLGDLRDWMRSRWVPPAAPELDTDRNVVVLFSLAASGELTGACFNSSASPAAGANAVLALRKASPYEPMSDKTGTDCLAGRRLTGNFTAP